MTDSLLRRWAERVGRAQVALLLSVVYLLGFLPAAPAYRWFLDPLRRRPPRDGRGWLARAPREDTPEAGRRQS